MPDGIDKRAYPDTAHRRGFWEHHGIWGVKVYHAHSPLEELRFRYYGGLSQASAKAKRVARTLRWLHRTEAEQHLIERTFNLFKSYQKERGFYIAKINEISAEITKDKTRRAINSAIIEPLRKRVA